MSKKYSHLLAPRIVIDARKRARSFWEMAIRYLIYSICSLLLVALLALVVMQ